MIEVWLIDFKCGIRVVLSNHKVETKLNFLEVVIYGIPMSGP